MADVPEAAASLGRALEGKVEVAFLREGTPLEEESLVRGHLADWFIESSPACPGRMALRGEMQMSGYWHAPEATRAALVDGWLITGDLAYQDGQGNVFMLGRADDIINMGGEKISPVEMENKEAVLPAARRNRVIVYGFENPSALILVSNDVRNPDGCQDASCAAENMMLAAHSYGIGSVWLNMLMKLRDEEPVKSLLDAFGVPAHHTVWAAVALGYPVAEGVKLKKNTDVIRFVNRRSEPQS